MVQLRVNYAVWISLFSCWSWGLTLRFVCCSTLCLHCFSPSRWFSSDGCSFEIILLNVSVLYFRFSESLLLTHWVNCSYRFNIGLFGCQFFFEACPTLRVGVSGHEPPVQFSKHSIDSLSCLIKNSFSSWATMPSSRAEEYYPQSPRFFPKGITAILLSNQGQTLRVYIIGKVQQQHDILGET